MAVFTVSETGSELTSWSPDATSMFGYAAVEAVGQPLDALIVPEHLRRERRQIYDRVRDELQPITLATVRRHKTGHLLPVELTVSPMLDSGSNISRYASIAHELTELRRAQHDTARLAAIVTSSADAIVSKTLDGIVTSWNRSAEQLFGYSAAEMIGQPILRLIPSERQNEEDDILARLRAGKLIDHYETVRIDKNGQLVDVSLTISPIRDGRGRIIGASKIIRDISDRKRQEAHTQLLLREVNHRTKNILNLVQVIARQTAASEPHEFISRFGDRIRALAASQDLLIRNNWHGVDFHALVRAQLAHFQDVIGSRIRMSGPSLEIKAASAQALGMALHEMATNAAKYGALSDAAGIVDISWSLAGDPQMFEITWSEHGGPPVNAPVRKGFGTTVISEMLRISLDCKVTVEHAPAGFRWLMTCAAIEILERPPKLSVEPAETSPRRKRILVVEDEALVALEITSILEDAGFEVVGPASTVSQALSEIDRLGCDAAILDINLGQQSAEPVARRLIALGIPIIAVSGYMVEQQPALFRTALQVGKPLHPATLIATLTHCLAKLG